MNRNTITLVETDAGHFYKIVNSDNDDIQYLPSSTTILKCFPNPQLDFWLENTSPEEIRKKQDEGKTQGSKVHNLIELLILGEKVLGSGTTDEQIKKLNILDKKLANYLKEPLTKREEEALVGAENFWEIYKPIVSGSELMVYEGKHRFAGTMDFIGYLYDKKTKKYDLWIVDYKISKALSRGYDLQLASYWKAFEYTYHRKLPKIRLGILQLGKNKCNYSFKEIKDKRDAWSLFLTTKKIYDDLHPYSGPPTTTRREEFELPQYRKKGKTIKV